MTVTTTSSPPNRRPIPIVSRNPFSRLFLAWLWPGFHRSLGKRELLDSDVGTVTGKHAADLRANHLEVAIARNERRSRLPQKLDQAHKRLAEAKKVHPADSKQVLALQKHVDDLAHTAPPRITIWTTVMGHRIQLAAWFMHMVLFGLDLLNTFSIKYFMQWYMEYASMVTVSREQGYIWGGIIFFVPIFRSFLEVHAMALASDLSVRVRSGLIGALYDKILRVTSGVSGDPHSSAIVTLLFTDSNRIQMNIIYWHLISSLPFGFIISFALLIWSSSIYVALTLIAVLIVLFPTVLLAMTKIGAGSSAQLSESDGRVNRFRELVSSISVIKLFGYEEPMRALVDVLRKTELKFMRKTVVAGGYMNVAMNFIICVDVFAVSTVYIYTIPNDPVGLFATLSLAITVLFQIVMLSPSLVTTVQSLISIRRLNYFMSLTERAEEITPIPDAPAPSPDTAVAVTVRSVQFPPPTDLGKLLNELSDEGMQKKKDAAAAKAAKNQESIVMSPPVELVDGSGMEAHPVHIGSDCDAEIKADDECRFEIRDLSLTVRRGETVGIVGAVGSGKTALLNTMLGEMAGTYNHTINGSVAFCAQSAWLFAGTIRDNIVCHKEFNEDKYNRVCAICCLLPDFATLIAGDRTSVGEGGVTLSGGQKQRVALARAVYADADVYVLDDIVSALDAHVGRSVMTDVVYGALSSKTVVIVTHQTQHLAGADRIVVLGGGREAGKIVAQGTFEEMLALGHVRTPDEQTSTSTAISRVASTESVISAANQALLSAAALNAANEGLDDGAEEEVRTGAVPARYYYKYFKPSGGVWSIIGIVLFCALGAAAMPAMQSFMSFMTFKDLTVVDDLRQITVIGLAAFCIGGLLCTIASAYINANIAVKASSYYHNSMLARVFRAPMAWFDVTPMGRIVNRFSRDLAEIDQNIPNMMLQCLNCFVQVVACLCTIGTTHWIVTVLIVVALVLLITFLFTTLPFARQMKRLDSKRRSPIYSAFNAVFSGLSSIRSYGLEKEFRGQTFHSIDESAATSYLIYYGQQSQSILLRLGNMVTQCGMVLVYLLMSQPGKPVIEASMAQMAFQLVIQVMYNVQGLAEAVTNMEMGMSSVERVIDYAESKEDIPEEAPLRTEQGAAMATGWPQKGLIEFDSVHLRYRPELPEVLHGITFDVKPGEKVGIVGRSGSGKSTIGLSLFRMIEIESGMIRIDGVDTRTIGLHDLRHRLAAIPQAPTLFTGTLRYNLDPESQHTDVELWTALEAAQLRTYFEREEDKLDFQLTAGGENLSAGQRQLVCLARALIRGSRILLCDEATASVDAASDRAVQTAIAVAFRDATVLTIAHRLDTVATCDRVIVLDQGAIVEYDSPRALLEANGAFAGLCRAAGAATWNTVAELSHAQVTTMAATALPSRAVSRVASIEDMLDL